MKTIGVLGGMGPQATLAFETEVHRYSQERIPRRLNEGYPPMVTYYLRHAPVAVDEDGAPSDPLTLDPRLLYAAARLGALVDFLAIPCNTPHFFLKEIEEAAGRNVLSIVDVTMDELHRRRPERIGLLGLKVPKVYSERFEGEPFETFVAPDEVRAPLDRAILKFLEDGDGDAGREAGLRAVESVRKQGAQVIVLGCTELPLLLGDDALAADLLDPGQLLAQAAVRHALD